MSLFVRLGNLFSHYNGKATEERAAMLKTKEKRHHVLTIFFSEGVKSRVNEIIEVNG